MTTAITYRGASASPTSSTAYKNEPLENSEIDGNFRSVELNKIDIEELATMFDEIKQELEPSK